MIIPNTTAIGCRIVHIYILPLLLILLLLEPISAWSTSNNNEINAHINRREYIKQILTIPISSTILTINNNIQPAIAYTPDTNPLRESLYYISRVQEATVQQERFITKATKQDILKNKMKLTLRLVEKNYKLLDQITFCAGMLCVLCISYVMLCMYSIYVSMTLTLSTPSIASIYNITPHAYEYTSSIFDIRY